MLSACKERGVKLLCAVSPSAGTDALEAASHGTKGLFFAGGQHLIREMNGLCSFPGDV